MESAIISQSRVVRLLPDIYKAITRSLHAFLEFQYTGQGSEAEEIASQLEMAVEQFHYLLSLSAAPAALDSPLDENSDRTVRENIAGGNQAIPEQQRQIAEVTALIRQWLKGLTQQQREIVELRFGLWDDEIYTLERIGGKFNLTRERMRQIQNEALNLLRRNLIQRGSQLTIYCNYTPNRCYRIGSVKWPFCPPGH